MLLKLSPAPTSTTVLNTTAGWPVAVITPTTLIAPVTTIRGS
jgi:hypothetical protein